MPTFECKSCGSTIQYHTGESSCTCKNCGLQQVVPSSPQQEVPQTRLDNAFGQALPDDTKEPAALFGRTAEHAPTAVSANTAQG